MFLLFSRDVGRSVWVPAAVSLDLNPVAYGPFVVILVIIVVQAALVQVGYRCFPAVILEKYEHGKKSSIIYSS